ncbi:hypothetical protein VPH35_087109 [Triticum aestivum]
MPCDRMSKLKPRKFVHIQLRREVETEVSSCCRKGLETRNRACRQCASVSLCHFWRRVRLVKVGMKHSKVLDRSRGKIFRSGRVISWIAFVHSGSTLFFPSSQFSWTEQSVQL